MPPATIAPAIPPTSNSVDSCALSAGLRVAKTDHGITENCFFNITAQET
jgi:hypothetical protein